jgi:hypothetical protein
MVGKDIYTNCGTVGQTEWPDGATRVASDIQWASRADGHPDGCPTEGGRAPDGGCTGARRRAGVARRRARWVSDGGQGLGGGPTGDYIRATGPPFWTLSSCAQSHQQEMRERRVLMRESGPLRGEFRKECSPSHCFYN